MQDFSFGIIPIHESDGVRRFLLVHQKKGHWGFPKGHAEPGETPLQSAQRELAEETGITNCRVIDCEPFYDRYTYINKAGQSVNKTVTFFLGQVDDPEVSVQPEEVQDHAWLTAEEAMRRLTFPEARTLLKQVLEFLDSE
ncbi:MAG: NUDIX domain-containing protein [Gammaproteobacteria bacterium]|nr:MAG: NUDIX domain-containing protein [Gammaproteobacteria bacterium]